MSVFPSLNGKYRANVLFGPFLLLFGIALFLVPVQGKNAPVIAIDLYGGATGPAYAQISDLTFNGKNELRLCGTLTKIDKSNYGKLVKVIPGVGDAIEYGSDGVLTLTRDKMPECVVPSNVKYEKDSLSIAELAQRTTLLGKVLSSSDGESGILPPLKPGVKIVLVAAPDNELAEFLRADRAMTVPLLKDYLGRFPSAPHSAQAKDELATLFAKAGEDDLAAYQSTNPGLAGPFPSLKDAKSQADQALAVLPGFARAAAVNSKVHDAMNQLLDAGNSELAAFRKAMKEKTPGYAHLTMANKIASSVLEVDPQFQAAVSFQADASHEVQALDEKVAAAGAQVKGQHFDEAYKIISPYKSFAGEEPRIAAVIDSAYQFHMDAGRASADKQDFSTAVLELQKAAEIKATPDVDMALKSAKSGVEAAERKKAAEQAIDRSRNFAAQKDFIQAYETLAQLPPAVQPLVADEMQNLVPSYIDSASTTAQQIKVAHDPIKGLADETSIQQAYLYLKEAYRLSNDAALKDRMDDLGDRLSAYYLDQARRYFDKPIGSGAGLGWSYLEKALDYKASNLNDVRDEITKTSALYQLRSKLSIRVVFRDQTSRRDSAGFADQLADAIATGLETSGLPVTIIRPGETPVADPNFQLTGDVLRHTRTMVSNSQAKDSKYRAGEQEIPNDAWNVANRDYESANLALQSAQAALQASITHGKKKEIDDANAKVTSSQKAVSAAHEKLDSIPKTIPMDIIKPYTYTEKQIDLGASVQIQYRVNDLAGSQMENTTQVSKDASQKFSVLENVKPEDTEGVKVQGTVPDDIQFLGDVENAARDALIDSVKKSVAKLPGLILQKARSRAADGDLDNAAESYILYLNAIPAAPTPERQEAETFLRDKYNIEKTISSSSR